MHVSFRNTDRPAAFLGTLTLILFIAYGLTLTLFPLLPLWLDEWLLLDNLKFKSSQELWGHLDRTQQFPRLYLQLIKQLNLASDYAYWSLRLPAFIAHCAGLALLWRLSARLLPSDAILRWLWIMIYVSFSTSIHYFVQLKQYTAEMALALLAIWQLLEFLRPGPVASRRKLMLIGSLLIAPFFSYTYPIVLAPVFIIAALQAARERRIPSWRAVSIAAGIISIIAMYGLDTRHVLADPGMQDFWQDLLMKSFSPVRFFRNIWMAFCTLGAGDLFGNLFGALGLTAFLRACWCSIRSRATPPILLYSCLLVWIAIALFVAGKLPLGTFRLNSFLVPAIAYMIVDLLRAAIRMQRAIKLFALALFLAATGTVYATMAELGTEEHRRKLAIYKASEAVLLAAKREGLPVFVSSGIAFPFEDRWPGDWILKVQPAYHRRDSIPVYNAPMNASIQELKSTHPELQGNVLYLDGTVWKRLQLP